MENASFIPLQAGRVAATFDSDTLWLNHLRDGDTLLLRAVYPTYRDARWATALPRLEWVQRDIGPASFHLRFRASYPGLPFTWDLELIGREDHTIIYRASGHATEPVSTNRAGFCVLHQAALAGQPCRIRHVSGAAETEGHFPDQISPRQPFEAIRAISHFTPDGCRVEVLMEGDTFEMEDQRNWTDASFKTYCHPQSLPKPYTIQPGEDVEQTVTVTATFPVASQPRPPREMIATRLSDLEWHPLPELGLLRTNALPLADREAFLLSGVSYLRADLDATQPLGSQFQDALRDARAMKAYLEIGLYLGPDSARHLAAFKVDPTADVRRWLIYGIHSRLTQPGHLELVRGLGLPGELGGGCDGNFADLNQGYAHVDGLDFAGFSMQPQVHSFDDLSVMENAGTHGLVLRSARAAFPGLRFHAPSISLRQRSLPWDNTPAADPRLPTEFGAAWTLASLVSLIPTRVPTITLHGTTGPGGILDSEGQPTAIWNLLGAVYGAHPTEAAVPPHDCPERLAALVLRYPGGTRLVAINLTAEPLTVDVDTRPYMSLGKRLQLPPYLMYRMDIPDKPA